MKLQFGKAFHTLLPSLMDGIGVVVYITLIGFILSLIVGLLLAVGRKSRSKVLNVILGAFVELIRGTPLLVQFFYIYYVIPAIVNGIADSMGYISNFQIDAAICGIIGFAINYGCYMSEVIRAAIIAIDPGQREAGLALGFSEGQVMRNFVIPPAIRNSIPVFGNYLVMMIKDTSLLAMISVQELLLRTKTYASQTFQTVESYTIVALVYLALSIVFSQISKLVERRLSKKG